MTYEEALEIVEAEFETRPDSDHSKIIKTHMTYDGCTGFCVVVYNEEGVAILTDMGETAQFFDEVPDEEWESLCREGGCVFARGRIKKRIESIEDVYDYIRFLDEISDRYWHEDE